MVVDPFQRIGLNIILVLQSLGDWLKSPMMFFSFLGYEEFYLFFAPILYWCINASAGLRVGLILMANNGLNAIFKLVFHGPRPYWLDPRVSALSTETSFGAPSGHAQNGVVFWGALAAYARPGWAWFAAVTVMVLIGISRMYLGVHFPGDVILGWLLGALILFLFLRLERPVLSWIRRHTLWQRVLLVFLASLCLIFPGWLLRLGLEGWALPSSWQANAALAAPQAGPIAPLSLEGLFTSAGVFFGLAAGALLLDGKGGFTAEGPLWKRLLRFPVGLAGVILLWSGLGALFPRGELLLSLLLRYVRYALIGLWVSALAPELFIRWGLAQRSRPMFPAEQAARRPARA